MHSPLEFDKVAYLGAPLDDRLQHGKVCSSSYELLPGIATLMNHWNWIFVAAWRDQHLWSKIVVALPESD